MIVGNQTYTEDFILCSKYRVSGRNSESDGTAAGNLDWISVYLIRFNTLRGFEDITNALIVNVKTSTAQGVIRTHLLDLILEFLSVQNMVWSYC